MISNSEREAFVWIWLPDETTPVVAGRLEADNGNILFNYQILMNIAQVYKNVSTASLEL